MFEDRGARLSHQRIVVLYAACGTAAAGETSYDETTCPHGKTSHIAGPQGGISATKE